MTDDEKQALVSEMRSQYQVPPYISDEELGIKASNGLAYLDRINPGCDPVKDELCKSLVENYMYYDLHHKSNEFPEDYAHTILMWQLSTEVTT